MLLTIDWDAYSGTREFVFDAPIWGTADREYDRHEAWQHRDQKRTPTQSAADFPLYDGWQELLSWNVPTYAALSHAAAYDWVSRWSKQTVLNIDSHHDLCSLSGDGTRVRPGNWAGLALERGFIERYTCQYPTWHTQLAVAEGYDLVRTYEEIGELLAPSVLNQVQLCRSDTLPDPSRVTALLLIQSPAWCHPAHDSVFFELVDRLNAELLEPLCNRL